MRVDRLALVTLVVPAYDGGLAFFTAVGFEVVEDSPLEGGRRWVVVRPAGAPAGGAALLLAAAAGATQAERVGDQTGGRVAFFLHTDDLAAALARWRAAGAVAEESPRSEAYGEVCVVRDPWGNRWDLVQPGPV